LIIGQWPWYIISFEVAAIVHFLLIYAPFWLAKRRTEKAKIEA
jgi:uncharacterized membrane protein YwaF